MILLKGLLAALAIVGLLLLMTPFLDRHRQGALRRILKDTAEVLQKRNVSYWADFGTLLGLVRDGDIIPGDKDVDLCVLDDERERVMGAVDDFAARGYFLTGKGGAAQKLMRVFDAKSPFYADIYPYVAEGDTLKSVLDPRDDVPAHLVKETDVLLFRGTEVRIPREVEALLAYRYGDSYRTPRRNDKGRAGGAGPWHSLLQDLEASALFVWFHLRRAVGVGPSRA